MVSYLEASICYFTLSPFSKSLKFYKTSWGPSPIVLREPHLVSSSKKVALWVIQTILLSSSLETGSESGFQDFFSTLDIWVPIWLQFNKYLLSCLRQWPHARDQGWHWECQAAMVQEWLRGVTPRPRPGQAAGRSYPTPETRAGSQEELPMPEVRGAGWEEQPHVQGVVAVRAQEGPRGATPRPKSGGAVVSRYPLSKVRRGACALLEQPWSDTPRPR